MGTPEESALGAKGGFHCRGAHAVLDRQHAWGLFEGGRLVLDLDHAGRSGWNTAVYRVAVARGHLLKDH